MIRQLSSVLFRTWIMSLHFKVEVEKQHWLPPDFAVEVRNLNTRLGWTWFKFFKWVLGWLLSTLWLWLRLRLRLGLAPAGHKLSSDDTINLEPKVVLLQMNILLTRIFFRTEARMRKKVFQMKVGRWPESLNEAFFKRARRHFLWT